MVTKGFDNDCEFYDHHFDILLDLLHQIGIWENQFEYKFEQWWTHAIRPTSLSIYYNK